MAINLLPKDWAENSGDHSHEGKNFLEYESFLEPEEAFLEDENLEETQSLDPAIFFGIDLSIKLIGPQSILQSAQNLSLGKESLLATSHKIDVPVCPIFPVEESPNPKENVEAHVQEAGGVDPAANLSLPPAPKAPIKDQSLLENESSQKPALKAAPKQIEEEKGAKLDDDISNLNNDLMKLRTQFDETMRPWKQQEYIQNKVITCGKYIHANRDNIKRGFSLTVNSRLYERIDNVIVIADNAYYKYAAPFVGLLFSYFKLMQNNQFKPTLEALKHRYYDLDAKVKEANFNTKPLLDSSTIHGHSNDSMAHLKARLDTISVLIRDIEQDVARSAPKNGLKFAASVIPLALVETFTNLSKTKANKWCKEIYNIIRCCYEINYIFSGFTSQNEWLHRLKPKIFIDKINSENRNETEQKSLQKKVRKLLDSLDGCANLDEVSKLLAKRKTSFQIPELFVEWQENFKKTSYKRAIVQAYYHGNGFQPFMNSSNLDALLEKRQSEFNQKVHKSIDSVIIQIIECKNKTTFEQISKHFAQFNIYLDRLNPPVKTKADWDQKVDDLNFQKSLAMQWVAYHETTAQLAELSLRQLLVCQNNREYKFLVLNGFESCVHIGTSIAKMGLTLVDSSINIFVKALSFAVHDITEDRPYIGLIILICPELTIKFITLIMAGVRLVYGSIYKPNEYSFEGYKIELEIQWTDLVSEIHSLVSFFDQALLWINIHLIENIVFQLEADGLNDSDSRYIQIDEKLKQQKNDCKHQQSILIARLNELRTMDNNINLFPYAGQRDDEVKAVNGYVNAKNPHCRSVNHVEILADALRTADFDLWPDSVRQFIGEELGIELKNQNKEQIIQSLRATFLLGELSFINNFEKNREILIKA